jgi:hypothetical protein
MIALDPVLKFAGLIAGVGAHFKHGDNHNLHHNGLGFRHRWARETSQKPQRKKTPHIDGH